jgi:hypothetical protein
LSINNCLIREFEASDLIDINELKNSLRIIKNIQKMTPLKNTLLNIYSIIFPTLGLLLSCTIYPVLC